MGMEVHCRGSWDPDAMSFVDRNLCRMLRKAVSKKKPEDYESGKKHLWKQETKSVIGPTRHILNRS